MTIIQPRSEYLTSLERRVRTLEQELDQLEAKGKASMETPSTKLAEVKKMFEDKRQALRAQMSKASEVGESAWQGLQEKLESAWTDLGQAYQEVRSELAKSAKKVKASMATR